MQRQCTLLYFLLLTLAFPLYGSDLAKNAEFSARSLKRIYAHMRIEDCDSACHEAMEALQRFPKDRQIHEAAIKAFASAGNEKQTLIQWNHYLQTFPAEELKSQELQEAIAWGVIKKASHSASPIIRLSALLAAFFASDAKSVNLIKKYFQDPNSLLRASAIQLASNLCDSALCDDILSISQKEKVWQVRLQAIKAIGKMKIKKGHSFLLSIIKGDHSSSEEKFAAMTSLILLLEKIDRSEIVQFAASNRATLRLLACRAIAHLQSHRDIDKLIPLAYDSHPEVRSAALYALGILRVSHFKTKSIVDIAKEKLNDPSPETAIMAAWLLTLLEPECSKDSFSRLLNHGIRNIRLLAAGALASTGRRGIALMKQHFHETKDPFVKMNLALGMIQQQESVSLACEAIHKGFIEESGHWMRQEDYEFNFLAPSNIRHEKDIPNMPEAVNQQTRLEILNILAIMKYPEVQELIKKFLQQKKWGISGIAAALLLTEGDEEALEAVRKLLQEPNNDIKLQAALILALWSGGEDAITTLEQNYPSANRETKEKILEGIGRIGSSQSIPFLLDKLQEPQQLLRVIAAAALLQCLYH